MRPAAKRPAALPPAPVLAAVALSTQRRDLIVVGSSALWLLGLFDRSPKDLDLVPDGSVHGSSASMTGRVDRSSSSQPYRP